MFKYLLFCILFKEAYSGFGEFLYEMTINRIVSITERCDDKWVRLNTTGLIHDLEKYVYGQPLLRPIIIPSLEMHLNPNYEPKKPLVLSFHGWPGTGKNYVADFIVKNMFLNGIQSRFRRAYHGSIHFPINSEIEIYKRRLQQDIEEQIALCPKSIFLFDEIDKMPDGIFDALKPYLDYNGHINHIDYRRSIFIFLSNIGSNEINEKCVELSKRGHKREEYTVQDFEKTLMKVSYNEKGGLRRSKIIEHYLIDAFVPFMPLERRHVVQCIKDIAARNEIELNNEKIKDVLGSLVFGPGSVELFSSSGCKNLESKINIIGYQMRWPHLFSDEL